MSDDDWTRCPYCMVQSNCTNACAAEPECTVCHRPKALRGRSYPLADNAPRCDYECPGYVDDPYPGHLWPSEWREHQAGHPRETTE